MMLDPFQHFLGVDESADAATLLGLGEAEVADRVRIEGALRDRLGRLFQHPDHHTDEAEYVREALRRAADELNRRAAVRRDGGASHSTIQAAPTSLNLTSFDRMVLAVLVGSGGWNARSRGQLVSLASTWGVSVQGLCRVIEGLSQYAQAGGARLSVADITSGKALAAYMPTSPTGAAVGPPLLDRLTENLSVELKRENPWTTIKLSMVFGLITVAACIIGVRIAFAPAPAVTTPSQAIRQAPPQRSQIATAIQRRASTRLALYPQHPTFLGNAVPPEALASAADLPSIITHLDDASRKLTLEQAPSEAVYRNWEESVKTISTGWLLGDLSTRSRIDQKINELLRAAGDRPTVSDRLLLTLAPPRMISDSLSICRGAWQIGSLARISGATASNALPPVVVERARATLHAVLGSAAREEPTFETAASLWLDSLVPQLVARTETDAGIYDQWEMWLAVQRGIGRGERYDHAILRALRALFATNTDLSRPGPSVNVVGRLLKIGLESPSGVMKQSVLEWFDAEEITQRDLWVLTSLLMNTDSSRWFPERLVLPEEADQRHRWRIRDELATVWPSSKSAAMNDRVVAQGRAMVIDPGLAARWNTLLDAALAEPMAPTPGGLLRQLLATSFLIEAAHAMGIQDTLHADNVLADADLPLLIKGQLTATRIPKSTARTRIGTAMGVDGEWARTYQEVGRNVDSRLQLLHSLRSTAGGDLGPIDAELLVREVYRGSPMDVRSAAQEAVVQLSSGPTVAMSMLDQFAEAPPSDVVSRVIAEFTNQSLPSVRSGAAEQGGWSLAARMALLTHAMQLQSDIGNEIDDLSDQLVQSYASRLSLMRHHSTAEVAGKSVQDAAEALARSLLDQASIMIASNPVPDTLGGLERRRQTRLRLADGPIQNFAAHQLTVLDALAYIIAAEQPAKRLALQEALRAAASARLNVGGVFEQMLMVERAIARLWKLRLAEVPPVSASDSADSIAVATRAGSGQIVQLQDKAAAFFPKLELLTPSEPLAYFNLAEEIFDEAAGDAASRNFASHLFALAGALDTDRLGRSACLALADLEPNARAKRRLRALAVLLGSTAGATFTVNERGASTDSGFDSQVTAAIALSEAFGYYRRGHGNKAEEALRKPGVKELTERCDRLIPGGATRFTEELRVYRGQHRPHLSRENLMQMLRLELALLSGEDRSWSGDLLLNAGTPLIEVDPEQLQESLGVDASKPYFRNGRWVDHG